MISYEEFAARILPYKDNRFKHLAYILHEAFTTTQEKEIPKKSGGMRKIFAYSSLVNNFLKELNWYLQSILPIKQMQEAHILGCLPKSSIKKITTLLCQNQEKNKVIFHIDIKSFFDKITRKELIAYLENYFSLEAAQYIARLSSIKGHLCQGSACSPILANLVSLLTFIPEIQEYCQAHKISYTLYVDDFTFCMENKENVKPHIQALRGILLNWGFKTHKVWIRSRSQRQKVLGVILNETNTPHIVRKDRKALKSIYYNIKKKGFDTVMNEWAKRKGIVIPQDGISQPILRKKFEDWLNGMSSYIRQF